MSMLALTDILGLIANEPYELSTLLSLEKYVGMQLNEREYDFEANKALLRSYQVNAEHVKLDVVVNTMVLSLMRLPSTDFLALSYIIPGKLPLQPKLKQVQKFADLLERAEFSKFWEEYAAADQSITSSADGFTDFIRTFIISNTSDTFTNISMDLLQSFLGLSALETQAFCKSSPLVEQVGEIVTFAQSGGQGKTKQFEESLRLDESFAFFSLVGWNLKKKGNLKLTE